MDTRIKNPLIQTIKERCRVCYTCVRECPAKAIRIAQGQAEVLPDRCIGCGRCVVVCSQKAKTVRSSLHLYKEIITKKEEFAFLLAPSFLAEFSDLDPLELCTMLRKLGAKFVYEVAIGADIVAKKYGEEINSSNKKFITTTCPAVVSYVEKYHPGLVKNLINIATPMLATARIVKALHGRHVKLIFLGPCFAKKNEAERHMSDWERIDAVLTFSELRDLFKESNIEYQGNVQSQFDNPTPAKGSIFPVTRGVVQAANLSDDIVESKIISTEGAGQMILALKEIEKGEMENVALLDPLCCHGCIMGPGMTDSHSQHFRQYKVAEGVKNMQRFFDKKAWDAFYERIQYLDFSDCFTPDDKRLPKPSRSEIEQILTKIGKSTVEDELNCGACGYSTCVEHAIAIHKGLAESEMCLPFTIEQLKRTTNDLTKSLDELSTTKQALVHNEKLASMGQLAAGIAHEVNNPLGVVLMYAHILKEELQDKIEHKEDIDMIVEQAERCKNIVSGLLNFARKNKVNLEPQDLVTIIQNTVKAVNAPNRVEIVFKPKVEELICEIDKTQIIQVLTNIITNAIEAIESFGKIQIDVKEKSKQVSIIIKDNGAGIDEQIQKKIFEPFFTTKQIGKGTGLGLAVTYGIIKMHKGSIVVESNADTSKGPTGTTFTILLPKNHIG